MTEQSSHEAEQNSVPVTPVSRTSSTAITAGMTGTPRPYHHLSALDDPANLQRILDRIASGTTQRQIAAELGCDPAALSRRLRQHPDHMLARELHHEAKLDEELETMRKAAASADVNLVRAWAETLRRTEWRAEREHPGRWGQRTHQTIEHTGDLGDRLRQARERVIDSTSQRVTDVMSTTSEHAPTTGSGASDTSDDGSTDGRGTLGC